MSILRSHWLTLTLVLACVLVLGVPKPTVAGPQDGPVRMVIVPPEDRFKPFAVTVRVGQTVKFVNNDEDDHTVVSDDVFNTPGHFGTDVLLPANGGSFMLKFRHPGVWVYYCRFHAQLDDSHQPIAPGPDGGIQDPNGNFGTPMAGVITVVAE